MKKKDIYIWACDFKDYTGEGNLGRLFVKELKSKYKFRVFLNSRINLNNPYISIFKGIIFCWRQYLNKKKVCYLNYLPFWNFTIFLLLPPKTILGPITGGAAYLDTGIKNIFIRGFLFPIFYKFSELLLIFRDTELIFSTKLLKKYLSSTTIKKSKFNYVIKNFKFKKKRKKSIDFLIYYKKHKNKVSFFPTNLIYKLIKNGFKINIVGDNLDIPSVKNYGYISRNKMSYLQSITKYTLASGENFLSLFIIECISHHVKVISNCKEKFDEPFIVKNTINLNFKKNINLKKLIN